jgi:hypothetical protein
MPKLIQEHDFDAVMQAVAQLAASGSVEAIGEAVDEILTSKLPRRTLQRRLALLVKQGRLIAEGRGRGSRYRLPVADLQTPLANSPLKVETRKAGYGTIAAIGAARVSGGGDVTVPLRRWATRRACSG